ncbi:MAG: formate dehydrogenase accessory sulfurtransferase FdhD [Desulfurococcales archaeon]|nr:formate dehydrogenase accessory sulfurtransferase FdhD [Desulfurococcales archaeon]
MSLSSVTKFRVEGETGVFYREIEGVRIAIDSLYKVYVDGVLYGDIVAMPVNLEEAGLGLAAGEHPGIDPSRVRVEVLGGSIKVMGLRAIAPKPMLLNPGECGAPAGIATYKPLARDLYTWGDVMHLFKDFSGRTAGVRYRISAHTAAIYSLDEGVTVVAHDTSRHTAVLKAIGLALVHGLLDKPRLAAVTTGRASADMVYRLASAGVGLIVTMRGPLMSGVEAARRLGLTLVSNAKNGRGRGIVLLSGSLQGPNSARH